MQHKIGIIGLGRAGTNHLVGSLSIPNVKVEAISDANEEKLKSIGEKYNIENLYPEPENLLENENLDIVIIAVPPQFHKKYLEIAIKNNKHILIEKPLAPSLREADECISIAKGYKNKIMVNENFRWTVDFMAATNSIDKGLIGEPYWVKVELLRLVVEDPTESKWLFKEKFRWLSEDGIHWFDLFNSWLKVEAVKVFAHLPKLHHLSEQSGDVFDIVHTVYENDKSATLIQHFASMGFSPLEEGGKNITEIRIEGSEGAIRVSWKDRVPGSSKDVLVEVFSKKLDSVIYPNLKRVDDYWAELNKSVIEHFIECIEKDKQPLVTMEEERKALDILFAAYKSSEIGQVVNLK